MMSTTLIVCSSFASASIDVVNANGPSALMYAWMGPFIGALIRPIGGMMADKLGGARVTQYISVVMVGCAEEPQDAATDSSTAEAEPVETPSVAQGMIEESNVQAIIEMTRMMELLRSFQGTHRFLESEPYWNRCPSIDSDIFVVRNKDSINV